MNESNNLPKLYDVNYVALFLNVHKNTLYKYIKAKKIKAKKIGKSYLISETSLRQFIDINN